MPRLFNLLRTEIISTRLKPGQVLSESEIAACYGVSRQPVREAFIKLADIGLLRIVPSKGSYVAKISMSRVMSAQFVREAIECALVEKAAQCSTPEQHAALQSIINEQTAVIPTGNHLHFNELDQKFHRAIAKIADCTYALQIIEDARAETDRLRRLAVPVEKSRWQFVLSQHQTILKAIIAKDTAEATKAMRGHLQEIVKVLPTYARNNPELFEDFEENNHIASIES